MKCDYCETVVFCLDSYKLASVPSSSCTSTTTLFNKTETYHPLPTLLLCTRQWLWGSRNSTQDPLTPISSPGASVPPSLGQSSPNGHPAVLSPGQLATRWDQAEATFLPPCMGEQGLLLHGRLQLFLATYSSSPVVFIIYLIIFFPTCSNWVTFFLHFCRAGVASVKNKQQACPFILSHVVWTHQLLT